MNRTAGMRQYLRAFIGIFVLVVLLRIRFAFALMAVLALLAWFAWVAGGRGRHIRVGRSAPARAFIGDELPVTLTISNHGRRRAGWASIAEHVPQSLLGPVRSAPPHFVMSLGPGESRTEQYSIVARRRGYHELGPATGTSGDPFGMRQVDIEGGPSDRVIVYPRVVPIRRLGLPTRSAVPALAARQALMDDPSRIRGLRGYRPGDSMRTIHWPATAATGGLLTKQFDPSTARSTIVALDLIQRDFRAGSRSSGPELAITAAASLLVHIINEEGLDAGLVAFGNDPIADQSGLAEHPARGERAHLMSMLDLLARVGIAREGAFAQALRNAAAGWSWASSVVVIAGGVSEELASVLLQLRRRGFAPTVLVIQAAGRPGPGAAMVSSQGIQVRTIDAEVDLGSVG